MDLQNLIISILIGSGLLTLIISFGVGWLAKKLKPAVQKNPEIARGIALIAETIVNWLVVQFPNASWDDLLKKAVDQLVKELGISLETATRIATKAIMDNSDAPNPPQIVELRKRRGLLT